MQYTPHFKAIHEYYMRFIHTAFSLRSFAPTFPRRPEQIITFQYASLTFVWLCVFLILQCLFQNEESVEHSAQCHVKPSQNQLGLALYIVVCGPWPAFKFRSVRLL
jgi:hypothetical protein